MFIVTLIWYRMKLKAFEYTGKLEGRVIKSENIKQANDGKPYQRVTIEYDAGRKICKQVVMYAAHERDLQVGDVVDMVCDETHPKRAEVEFMISDREKARKQWLVMPAAMGVILLIVIIIQIPTLINRDSDFSEMYMDFLRFILYTGTVIYGIREALRPESKLRKKKYGKVRAVIVIVLGVFIMALSIFLLIYQYG